MIKLNDIPGALDAFHIRLGPFVHAVWLATRKQVSKRALFAALRDLHTETVWTGKRISDGIWERTPKNYYANWECSIMRSAGRVTNKEVRKRIVVRVDLMADYRGDRAIALPLRCDLCGEQGALPLHSLFTHFEMKRPTHFFCPACHAGAEASAKRKTNTFTERLADRSGIADCERLIKAILSHKEQPNAEHA